MREYFPASNAYFGTSTKLAQDDLGKYSQNSILAGSSGYIKSSTEKVKSNILQPHNHP